MKIVLYICHMGRYKKRKPQPQGVHGVHTHLRHIYSQHTVRQKATTGSLWDRIKQFFTAVWPSI